MRTVLALTLVLSLASAGCGGGTHYVQSSSSEDDDGSSSASASTTSSADAGVDAAVDAGNPTRDRAMALFARSCTPCHRHQAPVDADAVEAGVYLETEEEILRLASAYAVGHTPTGLGSLIGQRAEGYELLVGPDQRQPMPPNGSGYAPLSQEEAGQIQTWFRAAH